MGSPKSIPNPHLSMQAKKGWGRAGTYCTPPPSSRTINEDKGGLLIHQKKNVTVLCFYLFLTSLIYKIKMSSDVNPLSIMRTPAADPPEKTYPLNAIALIACRKEELIPPADK